MNYNYHDGFIRLAAIFVLLAFAYIIGGGVVARETAQNQASALQSLRMQAASLQAHEPAPDYTGIPELE